MKRFIYIILVLLFISCIRSKAISDTTSIGIADIVHTFSLSYESYLKYKVSHNEQIIVEEEILNNSIVDDEEEFSTFGYGIRYSFHFNVTESNYRKLPLLGLGAEFFFDAFIDESSTDFYREIYSYGVIPQVRFLYILSVGYGFGYMNLNEESTFGNFNDFDLHDGISFINFSVHFPFTESLEINSSMDFIENKIQFERKWEIFRFRLGIGGRF